MKKRKLTSFTAYVQRSVWSVAALLIIPVVIGLTVTLVYTQQYQAMIQRMATASELKPIVETELAKNLFSVAAGRVSFSESGVPEQVAQVNETLEALLQKTDGSRAVQLTVARRTMDTVWHYAGQVRDGMTARRPVSEIEAIVDEVWQVGELAGDKIDAFLTEEIAMAAQAGRRIRLILLSAAGVEFLLLLGALLWTRMETRRLTAVIRGALLRLENTVDRIANGGFEERVSDVEVADLKNLADQINRMAARLEGLIEQNRLKQEHLAKAELRMLQAQINPHFLYNTLDAIIWQAEAKKTDEVISITRALSDFFRISLSSGQDWITIEQERRHLEGYLSIQKVRYRDILNYSIGIDDDIKDEIILKLLLQPLVENALYHGIKSKRGSGTIAVTGRREGEELVFAVHDTGLGIPPERLEAIRRSLREDDQPIQGGASHGSGFGLKNVDLRLRLYYGKEEGLQIESGDTGTTVSFRLPAGMKGNDHV